MSIHQICLGGKSCSPFADLGDLKSETADGIMQGIEKAVEVVVIQAKELRSKLVSMNSDGTAANMDYPCLAQWDPNFSVGTTRSTLVNRMVSEITIS